MDAPNIPQDEEEGGRVITMTATTGIEELVRREVVASLSLLSQNWLKEEAFISCVNAAVDEKISTLDSSNWNMLEERIEEVVKKEMDRKFGDQRQETNQLRSEVDNLNSTPNSNLPQNNARLSPTRTNQTGQQGSISNMFNRILPDDISLEQQAPRKTKKKARLSPISSILGMNGSDKDSLPEDVFSLMMLSGSKGISGALGCICFAYQMILYLLILFDLSEDGNLLNIALLWRQKPIITFGQFVIVTCVILTQDDLLSSIRTLILFWKDPRWDLVVLESNEGNPPPSTWKWRRHILFPNVLKFVQGFGVFFVSGIVIVKSASMLDLVKDFTAIMVVSELDNMVFNLAAFGYLGQTLYEMTVDAQEIKIDDIAQRKKQKNGTSTESEEGEANVTRSFRFQVRVLLIIFGIALGSWAMFLFHQQKGTYFKKIYPKCSNFEMSFDLAYKHAQDGECFGGGLNTIECGFEDGDCINFNMAYPLCKGRDLTDVQDEVGNDKCNMAFATSACDYDGGDCCPYNIQQSPSFGDGICDFEKYSGANKQECQYENGDCNEYNGMYCSNDNECCPLAIVNGTSFQNGICNGGLSATSKCRFDGTDCNNFRNAHPNCPFDDIAGRDGSDDVILGDGVCDGGVYSTKECGREFGDCAVGQIGQDLLDFGGSTINELNTTTKMTKMSADGSMLAVGMPHTDENGKFTLDTPGRVQLFRYDSSKKLWMRLDIDLVGDSNADAFGYSIAMNKNGSRLAVSAPFNNDYDYGQVKVFDINSSTSQSSFTQVGKSIYGESLDYAGFKIDLSNDGSRLAIVAPGNGNGAGLIRLFHLQDEKSSQSTPHWVKFAEILGQNYSEYIGRYSLHLSTSKSGLVVMFSVGIDNFSESSTHRVYALATTGTDSNSKATQIGGDIPSPYMPALGSTIAAMSGDGNRIAVASNVNNMNEPGSVQVFDYDDVNEIYDPIGVLAIISKHNPATGNGFGYSVALSLDGNTLAISSIKLDDNGNPTVRNTGTIELFVYDPTSKNFHATIPNPTQTSRNNNIIMDDENEVRRESSAFGIELSLAENEDVDGVSTSTWLSVQSYNFDTEKGYVKVYNLSEQFYPKCGVEDPSFINNGSCNGWALYNTEACGFEGGDCQPVDGFPGCFVDDASLINDGQCGNNDPNPNTEACGWDGGDCDLYNSLDDCTVDYPSYINNGYCTGSPPYNTEACGWDGGDCDFYNSLDDCTVDTPFRINDGYCDDDPPYNTAACEWDGGDCPTPTSAPA